MDGEGGVRHEVARTAAVPNFFSISGLMCTRQEGLVKR